MFKLNFYLLLFFFCAIPPLATGQEFPKVIIAGDYADPSIIRDGKDYYMTHSPFYYAPGFLIWHSKDLMNWEPVCRANADYEGSAMAPDLIKHKGRFYIYYPAAGTNWVIWADNIKGPWSKPVNLKVKGIDPGHVVGQDGKRYLYVDDGYMIGLTDDGLATVGERKKVYDGWKYPKQWVTEGMYLESPKLNHKDGYYYLTSAQGGTAGPATSHMVASARSKNVEGPWENSPYNPIVHTYSDTDKWWSKGHGTLIDDVNGNWWIVYHAYANGYYTLGRQTLIEPVEWTADGWFRTKSQASPIVSDGSIKNGFDLNDDFSGTELDLRWTFWKENALGKVQLKNNSLIVAAKGSGVLDGRLVLTTVTDKNYETQVEVTPSSGNMAGLLLYYSEKAFAGIVSDGKKITVYKNATEKTEVKNNFGKHFFLKIHNQGNICKMFASKDGIKWQLLAENIDVSKMHHNTYLGFYALRIGLFSSGKGQAEFKNFKYKNAVPTEADMSAYLMVFHKDDTHGLYMALSRDGYSFTALNDGKPVIAGDTIAEQKGIRDPHIMRGADGAFYLGMTDLHVFAQKAGYRTTEWEREKDKYGWGNNRGLVLMKSWDLVHWNRANVRFDKLSEGLKDIGCVWAPEMITDANGRIMIYYTMRFGNEANKIYYVYVNDDFNKIESLPKLLFEYADPKVTAIDADITKVGDKYHMFYVAHEGTPGIKQAVSSTLNSGYVFDPRWYDPESISCEAPNVWKRIGKDSWVLMYDCYGLKEHNFGFSETSDFVNFTNLGHFNEGTMKMTNLTSPKHGAVIHLTKEEADYLENNWKNKGK